MTTLRILRAGPATTVQDRGRPGMLQHGISASGPMDRGAFAEAAALLDRAGGEAIEITRAGLDFAVEGGPVRFAVAGGVFQAKVNGTAMAWPGSVALADGDQVEIIPGPAGNYGYLRFDRTIDVPPLMGSRATNLVAGLGGFGGRALRAGDVLPLAAVGIEAIMANRVAPRGLSNESMPIRFLWGIHADLFRPAVRQAFVGASFSISNRLDRMGIRLEDGAGVFAGTPILSLVSDAVVAGDIQILGDGTPIVLMRDHQPTGGYPRIGTVIAADLDRLAQMRPGTALAFAPVTLQKAHEFYLSGSAE